VRLDTTLDLHKADTGGNENLDDQGSVRGPRAGVRLEPGGDMDAQYQ
jgi:hypothetical protein